jgi:preprotein translocase subunit SecD
MAVAVVVTVAGCGRSALDKDTALTFSARPGADPRPDVPVVAKRLKVFGLPKAKIKVKGRKLVVTGAGSADAGIVNGVVTGPVDLVFRPVVRQTAGPCEAGADVVIDSTGHNCYLVGPPVQPAVADAAAVFSNSNRSWTLRVNFTEAGGAAFKDLATQQVNRQVAIVIGDTLLSVPFLQPTLIENFNNTVTITGNLNEQQAKVLAAVLAGGPLPVPLAAG